MVGDTSGDLQRFFVVLITGSRDQTGTSSNVDADVDALYAACQGKWGTNEIAFGDFAVWDCYSVTIQDNTL